MALKITRWVKANELDSRAKTVKWRATRDWAQYTLAMAQHYAPVDTGDLRNSLRQTVFSAGNVVRGEVYSTTPAKLDWANYGTGLRRKGGKPGSGALEPIMGKWMIFPDRGVFYNLILSRGLYLAKFIRGKKPTNFMDRAIKDGNEYWAGRRKQMQRELKEILR